MDVHIGNLIKAIIEKKGLIKEKVAATIGRQGPSFHKILSKKDISTDLIKSLSEAIDHDIFMEIAKAQSLSKPVMQDTLIPKVNDNYKEKYYSLMERYSVLQEKYTSVLEENKKSAIDLPQLEREVKA